MQEIQEKKRKDNRGEWPKITPCLQRCHTLITCPNTFILQLHNIGLLLGISIPQFMPVSVGLRCIQNVFLP